MRTYDPASLAPFRLSRSKIENYIRCARCFYLDRRLGVSQPSSPPFNLNNAVDTLLKREFDHYRASGQPHPLMKQNGLDAVPFAHDKMEEWREALRGGVRTIHKPTNFEVTGAVDDLWINPAGELIVVDYKATSKPSEPTLEAEWQISYKRQMEIYQWLLRQNGFKVSSTGYFVYANGLTFADSFDQTLHFSLTLLPYTGSDEWIEPVLLAIHDCLQSDTPPPAREDCEWCEYRRLAGEKERKPVQKSLL